MRESWNALIAVLLACQIAVQASPGSESVRKGIKLLCGLAALLAILAPIRRLPEAAAELRRKTEEYLAAKEESPADPYARTAQAILTYAAETAGLNSAEQTEPVTLTLIEDGGEVREMRLFLPSCPADARIGIETALEETYGIPVSLYTEPGADDGQELE